VSFDRSPFDGHRCRSVAAGDNIIAVAACEINVCERFMVIFIVVCLVYSALLLFWMLCDVMAILAVVVAR